MSDLRKLIEAVEDWEDNSELWRPALAGRAPDAMAAFHGRLDAAKALHDALLPGWGCSLTISAGSDEGHADVFPGSTGQRGRQMAIATNPARAWLLAILKAYEAQQ